MKQFSVLIAGTTVAVLGNVQSVWACATCFGAEGDPQTEGMNMAILTLMGITYTLLGSMFATIFFVVRNARKNLGQLSAEESGDERLAEDIHTEIVHG